MPRGLLPIPRLSFEPGIPNAVSVGVSPLAPDTIDLEKATEEAERLEAAANQAVYDAELSYLVSQAVGQASVISVEGDN